ncbi:MAG: hypothetical protein HRU19_08685 [Pseudobacteriovorax sp.]|nr:hypothetical protein [Pseudobacteriovorax sp.]
MNIQKSIILSGLLASSSLFAGTSAINFTSTDLADGPVVAGDLLAGDAIEINYNPERLRVCTGSNRLVQSFRVLRYKLDGGEVQSKTLTSGPITIATTADTKTLEYWFHNYSIGSFLCEAYDSNLGANYLVSLKPVVTFSTDIAEAPVAGEINAGESIVVKYPFARFTKCTAANRSTQSFRALYYSFDNGDVLSKPLSLADAEITIDTPAEATSLQIWVGARSIGSQPCQAWDSNLGLNYNLELN